MAYIQIVEFDDVTIDQFTDALATVKGSGMEGLILDLRGNPGGSLDAVVKIARKLLPEGMIVYTEDKAGKRTEYTCDGKTPLEVPLVVLVDMNSASASEILAGAIQDYGVGTLVGTTTFGKGSYSRSCFSPTDPPSRSPSALTILPMAAISTEPVLNRMWNASFDGGSILQQ